MAPCATCGDLPDHVVANTGREERLPPSASKLKALWNDLGMGAIDAMQCPGCGAWFVWQDDTSLTGSGVNDSESLDRLPLETWALFERLLHGELGDDPAAVLAAVLERGPWSPLLRRALQNLSGEPRERLVPALVERLVAAKDDSENLALYGLLQVPSKATTDAQRQHCERLARLLRRERDRGRLEGRAQYLLQLCEQALAEG